MKRDHDVRALLAWYPPAWRERYGEEFIALVHDSIGDGAIPMSLRRSVAVAGLRERCHESGLVGERSTVQLQRRTGSLVVLVAWAIMSVGGLALFKSAEHFADALPAGSRTAPQLAYDLVAVGGLVGTALVVFAAALAAPAFWRLVRGGGWSQVRAVLRELVVASALLVAGTGGLSVWAHHLSSTQRNGGNLVFAVAYLLYVLVVVLSLGVATRGAIVVVTRLELSPKVLRYEGLVALGVCVTTLVITASAIAWWIQMGLHAPWFLQGTAAGVPVSPWSAPMIITASVMIAATASALWGASRVAVTFRRTR